ncbi:MAG: T9SS type A sorting domain-containing protein [Bacteroidia bacterium]|nr:T9SS type A sorting domain-containing protein [Bacteroidia bacterium]
MKAQSTNQKTKFRKTLNYFLALVLFGSLKIFSQNAAAIKFDGAGDYVDLGPALTSSLNGGNSITIEAWVNTATNSGGHGPIIGNYGTNNTGALSFLLRRENGHHVFWVGNGTIYPTVSLNTSSVNVWTHLACVWNGTVAIVYVNGVLTASTAPALSAMQNYSNTSVYIGSAPLNSEHFNGMIDEVRVWNVARTRCQINTFKNCEIPANTPGLLVNYHFNQGIANGNNTAVTTLTDATSSAITGTLAGLTLTGTASNWVAPGGVVSGFTTAASGPTVGSTATNSVICMGSSITLNGTGASTYVWTGGVTNGTAFSPTTTVTYTVTGTAASTGCTNTAVRSVTVNPKPTITVNSGTICSGTSFTIVPSGASTYTISGGSTVVSPLTSTVYNVTGTNSLGCVSSNTAVSSITVIALPSINATANNTLICAGLSANLTASGGSTYTWNPGGIVSNTIVASPATSTTYSVTGTNGLCSKTSVISIIVKPLPTINVISNNPLSCVGGTVTLTATGGIAYFWTPGGNAFSITVSPTVTTTYSVNGLGSSGCSGSAVFTQSVTVCDGLNQLTDKANTLSVFPNPASSNITLQTQDAIESVCVFNAQGALLKTETQKTFSVDDLSKGIYFIQIKTENGIIIGRFVKD